MTTIIENKTFNNTKTIEKTFPAEAPAQSP